MKRRLNFFVTLPGTALTLALLAHGALSAEFPLRAKFPDVKPISTKELASSYDRALIVDVRSSEEYDVVHIAKALNIPVAKATFEKDLAGALSNPGGSPVVMYCNGITCAKSYEAARQAAAAGIEGVAVYDAGIFEWAQAHPAKTTLLGTTPADPGKIISEEDFRKKFVDLETFQGMARSPGAVLIDIRDPFQRQFIPGMTKLRNIPMERIVGLLREKKIQGEPLLIMDAVGKQVQWLQYHLEANGYKNYSFLEKGVKAFQP